MSSSLERLLNPPRPTCSAPKCRRLAVVRVYGPGLTKPLYLCKRCNANPATQDWLKANNLQTEDRTFR